MAMTPLPRPVQAGYRLRVTRGALVAACGVLAAACGSAAAPAASPGTTHSSAAPPGAGAASSAAPARTTQPAKVSLDVTLSGANTAAKHWTLRCDPPGGNSPDAAARCSALLTDRSIFSNRHPMRIMCPMIMADARVFTITGTFFGQHVHETIVDGSCDLSRWATLNQIFN